MRAKLGPFSITQIFFLTLIWSTALAQSEQALKGAFEGEWVEIRIDMPATKDGIDVFVDRSSELDYEKYSNRLRQHGISVWRGDRIMVTKIKLKKKHVEFHLGGGYGTARDDKGFVHARTLGKSKREKSLEEQIKNESDPKTKKELKNEVEELREERCRLNQLSREIARNAEAANQVRIQELALNGGSRFNLRYDHRIDRGATPTVHQLKDALAQYVIFDLEKTTAAVNQTPPQAPTVDDTDAKDLTEPSSTTLQTGLNWAQVFQLLGPPTEATSRELEGIKLMECVFEQENKAIKALFANHVLIRYQVFIRSRRGNPR